MTAPGKSCRASHDRASLLFTFCILLIGLGVISVPAGLVASALAKARQMEEEEKKERGGDLGES